jgi:2-oxoglutarate ferredoxin oxidoreductase subunit alpha
VGWRTLPATPHPQAAYFARGSGHNEHAQYSERAEDYVRNVDRLARKFENIRGAMPPAVVDTREGARIGLVCVGTSHDSVEESRCQLREEYSIETSYLRIRAFPFGRDLNGFIARHERVYVIEQNRDGQLAALMRIEMTPGEIARLRGVLHYGGLPIDARSITDDILKQEGL